MDRFLIYGLVDPTSKLVRYVGKSSSGFIRPSSHRQPNALKGSSTRLSNWVRKLQSCDLTYEVVVLEYCAQDALSAAEIWWIAYGKALGWPLTNLTSGGEGTKGYVTPDSVKAKLSAAQKLYMANPESRAKVSAKLSNRVISESTKAKFRGDLSRVKRPEVRAKISAALKGKAKSAAHKEAILIAARKREQKKRERHGK